jgi:hypothetical protein
MHVYIYVYSEPRDGQSTADTSAHACERSEYIHTQRLHTHTHTHIQNLETDKAQLIRLLMHAKGQNSEFPELDKDKSITVQVIARQVAMSTCIYVCMYMYT